ncbi:MAG TPA: hypothetical protein PKA54_09435 [Chitinophagaceae bacterium]|nr:MAG: hypothetical protein UZ11_BCD004000553 [Bacteroidetes bacterium OLB11]HMN33584.1 hypothetical protein [Chitinophagaceae bacterium]
MNKSILFLLVSLFIVSTSDAQNMRKQLKKRTAEAGLTGSLGYYGNKHWGIGVNAQYLHGIGRKKQRLAIGCGLRGFVFFTKERDYSTSSPSLVARNRGGADTMYMEKVQTSTINAFVAIKINIKKGVDIHLNTDIGGINFGDSKDGYFRSYETNPIPPGTKYKTEPYGFNVNMGNGSYGSLMSELYGSFRLNDQFLWRLGVNYYRNEYKLDTNIPMNGRRFYQNQWMAMTGIAVNLRWKKDIIQSQYFF